MDFYSGVVYLQLGFSPSVFPLLFAVSRMAGWAAHLTEFLQTPMDEREGKIVRPLQIYKGVETRVHAPDLNESSVSEPQLGDAGKKWEAPSAFVCQLFFTENFRQCFKAF